MSDAIDSWAGKGVTAPAMKKRDTRDARPFFDDTDFLKSYRGGSEKYQWLPANLKFRKDGTVRFSSYINNLHPGKYQDAYRVIEKIVDLAIPLWDQVLGQHGRQRARIAIPDHAE